MERYINQRVKLVCKVEQVMGSTVQVTTPDNAQVTIIVAPNSGAFESRFVEVEGTVMDPKTIREDEHTSFGDNIGALPAVFGLPPSAADLHVAGSEYRCDAADLQLYNEMIKLASAQYGSLFRA